MKNNIELCNLYVWGYQPHTQISFNMAAEHILSEFSSNLDPFLFLFGISDNETDKKYQICLPPEANYINLQDFSELDILAEQYRKNAPDSEILNSHPIAEENNKRRIKVNAYRKSIQTILEKKGLYDDKSYFISFPTTINNFHVFTILSINKPMLQNIYSLKKDKIHGRYTIFNSLFSAVIDSLFVECNNALKDPENAFTVIGNYENQIFKNAGIKLMNSISARVTNNLVPKGLLQSCNEIAALKYEGAKGIGNMILASKNHENIKYLLKLSEPINFKEHRKVRKFLELSSNNFDIISDTERIYGLGTTKGTYNPMKENLFYIKFLDHHKWELYHNDFPMLRVCYSKSSYPKEKINKIKFTSDLDKIFGNIRNELKEELWDIIITATEQKHGTMIVISKEATEEAERLSGQCFKIVPQKIDNTLIKQITSIDGAVLIDENTTCHAIGVILDGIATSKGNSARGARYNSAIRYYEANKKKGNHSLMIVVISEDGMIDIIPDLLPKIKHSTILKNIEILKKLITEKSLDTKEYNKIKSFFHENRFYLNESECNLINDYKKRINEKFKKETKGAILNLNDFFPSPEMNDSYYEENGTKK